MTDQPRRPVCGNDATAQLTDGDRSAVAEFRAYLARRKQQATEHPGARDAGPPHDGALCLPEGVGGWLCRYPLGDGHRVHTPYVEGEYLR